MILRNGWGKVTLKLNNTKRQIDIAVFLNRHVVQAITMQPCSQRDYKLAGLGVIFEVDQRLQDCFKKPFNELGLKKQIQQAFKGPTHQFDTCETGYLMLGVLPICWHISTVHKQTGKPEKFRYLEYCGKHLNYQMKVYRALDFAKLNPMGEVSE
jgi:hypothetical protein